MAHAAVRFAAGAAMAILLVTAIAGVEWLPFSGTRQNMQDIYHHHMLEQQDVVDFKSQGGQAQVQDRIVDAVKRAKQWRPRLRSLQGPVVLGGDTSSDPTDPTLVTSADAPTPSADTTFGGLLGSPTTPTTSGRGPNILGGLDSSAASPSDAFASGLDFADSGAAAPGDELTSGLDSQDLTGDSSSDSSSSDSSSSSQDVVGPTTGCRPFRTSGSSSSSSSSSDSFFGSSSSDPTDPFADSTAAVPSAAVAASAPAGGGVLCALGKSGGVYVPAG